MTRLHLKTCIHAPVAHVEADGPHRLGQQLLRPRLAAAITTAIAAVAAAALPERVDHGGEQEVEARLGHLLLPVLHFCFRAGWSVDGGRRECMYHATCEGMHACMCRRGRGPCRVCSSSRHLTDLGSIDSAVRHSIAPGPLAHLLPACRMMGVGNVLINRPIGGARCLGMHAEAPPRLVSPRQNSDELTREPSRPIMQTRMTPVRSIVVVSCAKSNPNTYPHRKTPHHTHFLPHHRDQLGQSAID